jgi:hypothetical protein
MTATSSSSSMAPAALLAYKIGSEGGFRHASRAAVSILLSTSDICKHHMHGPSNVVMLQHIAH